MPKDAWDDEDPWELVGVRIPGDAGALDTMARYLVEEYVAMGWTDDALRALFRDPFYRSTYAVYARRGEAYVDALIAAVRRERATR